jgi:hypothetical protein
MELKRFGAHTKIPGSADVSPGARHRPRTALRASPEWRTRPVPEFCRPPAHTHMVWQRPLR